MLELRASVTDRGICRVGLVIPKYGRTAVHRNQLKRRLRELVRVDVLSALRAAGLAVDVVMRALPSAYRASFHELRAEIETLRARLIRFVQASASESDPSHGADKQQGG